MKLGRFLVRLYPPRFRAKYARDTVFAFGEDWRATAGAIARLRLLLDLVAGLVGEWLHEVRRISKPLHWSRTNMTTDLRIAVRSLLRTPGYTIAAGLTAAIGVAATTTVFSVVYSALFQPPPFERPGELIQITDAGAASPANYSDLRDQVRSVAQLEASSPTQVTVTGTGRAQRVRAARVTGGLFSMLGRQPVTGRSFDSPEEVARAQTNEVVISHGFWMSQFGGEDVLGRTMEIDGITRTIVGVTPQGFNFPNDARLWLPLSWDASSLQETRASRYLYLWGRLSADASIEQAADELTRVFNSLVDEYPEENGTWRDRIGARSMTESLAGGEGDGLLMVGGAVLLVMLVVVANVGNLTMARSEARKRDYAVRSALGAGRARLFWMAVQESAIVVGLGSLVGVALAHLTVTAIVGAFGAHIPRASEVAIHVPVLLLIVGVVLISALTVAALGQASLRGVNLGDDLRQVAAARTSTGGRGKLRAVLMAGEVALALMLVTGAGLLTRSFVGLQGTDLGVDTRDVYAVPLSLPRSVYSETDAVLGFFDTLMDEVRGIPAVSDASLVSKLPFDRTPNNLTRVTAPAYEGREARFVEFRVAAPGLFETLGMEILEGRDVARTDLGGDAYPLVINTELRDRLFGDADPLEQTIDLGFSKPGRVVGVVSSIREWGPHRDSPPAAYLSFHSAASTSMSLVIKAGTVEGLLPQIRAAVESLSSQVPVDGLQNMNDRAMGTVGNRHFMMWLLLAFAGVAIVLGAVGVYGVMAYSVSQNVREIGVRMALGASRSSVMRLTIWRGLVPALVGIGVGLAGAGALSKTLDAVLVGLSSLDAMTYALSTVLLVMIVLVAAAVPAIKASRVDPVQVMRGE